MKKLSVVLVVKNGQEKIVDAIESANFADEVVVIDNQSTDMTVDISKKAGARVVKGVKGSYQDVRNRGLKEAKGVWIFYLDFDERIDNKLKDELQKVSSGKDVRSNEFTAFAVPRRNFIFGKEFKYGGEYPDYQKRLFKKSKLKKWIGAVHERPDFDGELGYLKNHLIHLKHDGISEMIDKTNRWSEIEAKLMFDAKHPPMNLLRFTSALVREFFDRFIKKKGYKDGAEGVIYSGYQVFSKFTSYAKLWEMQAGKSTKT